MRNGEKQEEDEEDQIGTTMSCSKRLLKVEKFRIIQYISFSKALINLFFLYKCSYSPAALKEIW